MGEISARSGGLESQLANSKKVTGILTDELAWP